MTQFSANLGFLWTQLSLPEAIHAAHRYGFAAVECHWPYKTPPEKIRDALKETGLPMLGLNTTRGGNGENGLSALPDRKAEARAAIMQAIEYADFVDARAIHVMAGFAAGPDARMTFEENLRLATDATDRMILIEPLNQYDMPGYFLDTTDLAIEIIDKVGASNLRLMFDCYHVGRNEGNVINRLTELLPLIGHIQFASVPDRGTPDRGELDYGEIFRHIANLGWHMPLGAEYKPRGPTETTLDWMRWWRESCKLRDRGF